MRGRGGRIQDIGRMPAGAVLDFGDYDGPSGERLRDQGDELITLYHASPKDHLTSVIVRIIV